MSDYCRVERVLKVRVNLARKDGVATFVEFSEAFAREVVEAWREPTTSPHGFSVMVGGLFTTMRLAGGLVSFAIEVDPGSKSFRVDAARFLNDLREAIRP